ncbi:MAG: DinB family protein [Candidatus Thorarchaeota archaeon]
MPLKEFASNTFDLAQWNVQRAILRLKPDDLMYQITPKTNPISWILGHLTWHMDIIFNRGCQGKSQLKPEEREPFATGAARMDLNQFPFSMKDLIENFLKVSDSSLKFLRQIPEEKINDLPDFNFGGNTETVGELIQRISLHLLGHVGQIYIIKKELGKGGYFVTGVKKNQREDSRIKWMKWWEDNKESYA